MSNTLYGPSGGVRIVDARVAPPGTWRGQWALGYFEVPEFLFFDDGHWRFDNVLSFSGALTPSLELFGAFASHASRNGKVEPEIIQVLAELEFGGKLAVQALPWLALGGDLRIRLPNVVGDLGWKLEATQVGARALATADLQALGLGLPLLARLNFGYFLDNSAELAADLEAERLANYGNGSELSLLSRAERFGLDIGRVDQLQLGVGLEGRWEAFSGVVLQPLLEYHLGLPVARQDIRCRQVATNAEVGAADGCLQVQGIVAYPSTLSLGLRVRPSAIARLGLLLAAEVGVTGSSVFVREFAPTAPYRVWLAVSYELGGAAAAPGPATTRKVAAPVELESKLVFAGLEPEPFAARQEQEPAVQAPAESQVAEKATVASVAPQLTAEGRVRIAGLVSGKDGRPIAGASVRYPIQGYTAQLTDEHGRFLSYGMPPGELELLVSHPEYLARRCRVQVPETVVAAGTADGNVIHVRCSLHSLAEAPPLVGQVVNEAGKPIVGAEVLLEGTIQADLITERGGVFRLGDLTPGIYRLRVAAAGYLRGGAFVVLEGPQSGRVKVVLTRRPTKALAKLQDAEIRLLKPIRFKPRSVQVHPKSQRLLGEVVDILHRHPELRAIEIQALVQGAGSEEANQRMAKQRAEAVKLALVDAGVSPERLAVQGIALPEAPNMARRRVAARPAVKFKILQREQLSRRGAAEARDLLSGRAQ